MASTFLTRTNSSSPSNANITTMSVWIKLSKILGSTEDMGILGSNAGGGYSLAGASQIGFYNGGLYVWLLNSSGTYFKQQSTRLLRDANAWYHIVVRLDSTQATGNDRIKVWVNNEEITAWSSTNDLAQNTPVNINGTNDIRVGRYTFTDGTHNYFDGSMSHFHLCDGQVYSPTDFGEYDATTGIWKPKTAPSVTYGTNGFFLKFENSGAFGTDSSGNANNFTVNGTMTQTIDTPSNVFATFNALYNSNQNLSNGNLSATNTTSTWNSRATTLAGSSGKYYAEYKVASPGTSYHMLGVGTVEDIDPSTHAGTGTGTVAVYNDNGNKYVEGTDSAYANTYGDGDIIGIALDLDNNYVYFSKNGTWQNSGDPTSGATGTGGISLPTTGTYAFTESVRSTSSSNSKVDANFGNGYFGTTKITSPYNDSNGIGLFNYEPPTNFLSLCTKSLNEQEYD